MSTELSYEPPKSSGAMWMGVPTIVHVIMASGLQNPRSVRVPRLVPFSCECERESGRERGERDREGKGGEGERGGKRDSIDTCTCTCTYTCMNTCLQPSLSRLLINSHTTHQHILEFDVSVQQALSMQESDTLHYIQSYLHPRAEV